MKSQILIFTCLLFAVIGAYAEEAGVPAQAGQTPMPTPKLESKLYPECTSKNDYLNADFAKLFNNKDSNYYYVRAGHFIPQTDYDKMENCIRESMNSHSGPFRKCDARGIDFAKGNVPKACMNKDYVDTATQSFAAVTDCFSGYISQPETPASNESVRRGLFSLISYESGFHTNAVSPTGALGIGQFTVPTINGVNRLAIDDVLNYAKQSDKASCKAIAKYDFKKYPNNVYNKRCETVSPADGNPMKNMIYTVGIQKLNRNSLETTMKRLPARTKAALEKASPEFREKLINQVINWSHNTGIGGIRMPFINLLSSQRGLELIAKEDLNGFSRELAPLVGQNHERIIKCPSEGYTEEQVAKCVRNKSARINEVKKFYQGMLGRQSDINKRNGGATGENKCGV